MADNGAAGRQSDSGLFNNSAIKTFLEGAEGGVPAAARLGNVLNVPYVLLADGGFGLQHYIMTPFTERSCSTPARRIYNLRLSSARRTVECAFGLLVKRYRVFNRPLEHTQATCSKIIHAAILLHNFMINSGDDMRDDLPPFNPLAPPPLRPYQRYAQIPALYRDKFVTYFIE